MFKKNRFICALLLTILVVWGTIGSMMGKIYADDPIAQSDAMVVLGGGIGGEREDVACEIYRSKDVIGTVILTGANIEEFIPDRQVYIQACGVPAEVIVRWANVKNTFEEMSRIAQQVRSGHLNKVIVVSDPPHMPRLRYLRKILHLEENVIFSQSHLSVSLIPKQFYRLLLFWYREPLAYLYYRMKYS